MKSLSKLWMAILMAGSLLVSSCDDDSEADPIDLEVQTVTDLPADPGAERGAPPTYTYFDLESGQEVPRADAAASTEWDIALAGTSILVNGGASGSGEGEVQVVEGVFEELDKAPESGYAVDTEEAPALTTSAVPWYNYTGNSNPAHAILPIPGRVIMLVTGEGNYAKLEIVSYYKGNPDTSTDEFASLQTRPESRYYTFRYLVREDGKREFEE